MGILDKLFGKRQDQPHRGPLIAESRKDAATTTLEVAPKSSGITKTDSLVKLRKELTSKGFSFPHVDLLFVSDKDPADITVGPSMSISIYDDRIEFRHNESDDPSTIFVALPIKKPTIPSNVEPPGYYPSYAGLGPEQRWIYLNWLQDVTKDVDVGYVFIYYYGLERHLLTGKFEIAFEEILKLRQYHKHKSFLAYSESALVNSALLMTRPDKMKELLAHNVISSFTNALFLIAYHNNYDLSAANLMLIFDRMSGLNKRYFKEDREQFQCILSEVLNKRFGSEYFPFANHYDIRETGNARYPLFANPSLPDNVRIPELPNFYAHERLMGDLKGLFQSAHEIFKARKAQSTKAKKQSSIS